MSEPFGDLLQLSREELYSMITAFRREINCLSTDLSRFESLLNKCHKCLSHLVNTKQIDFLLIQELLHLIDTNRSVTNRSTEGQAVIGGHSVGDNDYFGHENDFNFIGHSNGK